MNILFLAGERRRSNFTFDSEEAILWTRSELVQKHYAISQNILIVYCHVKFQWQETKKFERASGKNNNYYCNLNVLL